MADNSQDLEKLLDKLVELLNKHDSSFGIQTDALKNLKEALTKGNADSKKNSELSYNVLKDVKSSLYDTDKRRSEFYKNFKEGKKESKLYTERVEKTLKDLGDDFSRTASLEKKKDAIGKIRTAIKDMPDDQKKHFELQLEGYELLAKEQQKYTFTINGSILGLNNWLKTTNIATTATSAFSQVLNSSSNSFSMLNTAFTTGLQAATSGLGQMVTGLAMLAKNPIGMVIATVIQSALQFFTKATTAVFNLLRVETDKLINSFKTISSAGVTYSNGLEGLRQMVVNSGLTMEQFSNGVKQNADVIARSGLGVSEGSKKLSLVLESIRKNVDKSGYSLSQQLLNLGYSFEDQIELSAEVMAQMRRSGMVFRPGDNTQNEIAQRTAEYAKNLRVISDITGKDAKAKMDEARKINENMAFNQKLRDIAKERGMDEVQTAEFISKTQQEMSKLPALAQEGLKQQIVYNGAMIGDVGVAMAQLPQEVQASMGDLRNALLNGGEGLQAATGRMNDAMAQLAKDGPGTLLGAISAASALGGNMSGVAEQLQGFYNESIPRFKGAVEIAAQSVEGGAKTNNQMTTDLREAQRIQQQLRIDAEKVASEGLKTFANVMADTASVIQDAFEFIKRRIGDGIVEDTAGSELSNIPGAADGGPIPKGRTTLVGERGPELVVPAQNSMVIPNHFNLEPVVQSMHEQNRIGNEMLRYMKNMVDAQEKLVRAT